MSAAWLHVCVFVSWHETQRGREKRRRWRRELMEEEGEWHQRPGISLQQMSTLISKMPRATHIYTSLRLIYSSVHSENRCIYLKWCNHHYLLTPTSVCWDGCQITSVLGVAQRHQSSFGRLLCTPFWLLGVASILLYYSDYVYFAANWRGFFRSDHSRRTRNCLSFFFFYLCSYSFCAVLSTPQ